MVATRQMQKTRAVPPSTTTAITQAQSLEVVQTLVYSGLSSLAFTRELFPESAFAEHCYSTADGIPSYKAFADGTYISHPLSKTKDTGRVKLQVLRRDHGRRAAAFLDWLEQGAFAALKAARLHTIDLLVHPEVQDLEKVIETYTFTIEYRRDDQRSGEISAGLKFGGPGTTTASRETANSDLQLLVRRINDLGPCLPVLPKNRWISMGLTFLPGDETGPLPRGFILGQNDRCLFAQAEGWETQIEELHDLNSMFHTTKMRVTHLQDSSLRGLESVIATNMVPTSLIYQRSGRSTQELAHAASGSPGQNEPAIPEDASTIVPTPGAASTVAPTPGAVSTVSGTMNSYRKQHTLLDSPSASRLATSMFPASLSPSGNEPQMKRDLQQMMQLERLTQGDTQTQGILHRLPAMDRFIDSPEPAFKNTPGTSSILPNELFVLPDVAKRLQLQKQALRKAAMRKAGTAGARAKKSRIVSCECGSVQSENSVQCSFCGTWQHFPCLGFTSCDDPRIAQDHACHRCLVGERPNSIWPKLKELCIRRRAMVVAFQNGLKKKEDLAKVLSITVTDAESAYNYLRESGFVVPTPLSHKQEFMATGHALFLPTMGGPPFERLLQELFNPTLYLERFYSNASTRSNRAAHQLLAMIPDDMPFAEVSENRMSRNSASQARPRSSEGPLSTPTHSPRKRTFPEGTIFNAPTTEVSEPMAVYKRLKSVKVLRADGQPSSSPVP